MQLTEQIPENQTDMVVATGQIATGFKNGSIITTPLGSCIAVIAYDKESKIGGIAHIMLPGRSLKGNKSEENKYAENSIDNLLSQLKLKGASDKKTEVCLVGGANVLKRENDTIANSLVFCILEIVKQKKLNVKKTALGGFERRMAKLNLQSGVVSFSVGDNAEEELFNFNT